MKAMILAAGRGERMRPLTDTTPKPLLKIGNETLIEKNIFKLIEANITDIVINFAYLGDQIKKYLGDGQQYGVTITYSDEGDRALGPGGGIIKALPLLGNEHFVLMSADIVSDFPIVNLLNHTKYAAHLMMVNNPSFHPKGDYGMDENGFLTLQGPTLTYGSYSIWHPSVFKNKSCEHHEITPFITRLIAESNITGEKFTGHWINIGTPDQL